MNSILGGIFAGAAGAVGAGNGPGGIIQGGQAGGIAAAVPAIGAIANTGSALLTAAERFILDFYTHVITLGVVLIFVVAGAYLMFKPQIDQGYAEIKKQGKQAAEVAVLAA